MSDMKDSDLVVKEVTLDDIYRILCTVPANLVSEATEDAMTGDAWDLWSRCLYRYPEEVTPKSVLDSFVQDIEAEADGLY